MKRHASAADTAVSSRGEPADLQPSWRQVGVGFVGVLLLPVALVVIITFMITVVVLAWFAPALAAAFVGVVGAGLMLRRSERNTIRILGRVAVAVPFGLCALYAVLLLLFVAVGAE